MKILIKLEKLIKKKKTWITLISEKNNQKNLIVFEDFQKQIIKTKEIFSILKKNDAINSIVVLDKNSNENIGRSLKNIPNVKVSDTNNLVLYDLIKYKKAIFTETSIREFEKRYI